MREGHDGREMLAGATARARHSPSRAPFLSSTACPTVRP